MQGSPRAKSLQVSLDEPPKTLARGRIDWARYDGDGRAPQRVPTITVSPIKELNKEGLGQTSTWRRPTQK
jgi:hypothetical protein